ncbi:MAG: ATP-binding protein [Deltaproteobacteria bacterium]|nr:MAG: ATP-binding protein [Deltaproteobacteria bacterium]TMQ06625.1 MAG: ATP-binding protein [Deltaproteobacteria bacterium]
MVRTSTPPEATALGTTPLPDLRLPAEPLPEADAPDADASAAPEAEVPEDSEGLQGFPSREEEHLYLQLQRFAFCLDRFAARQAGAPPSPETGGEEPVVRIGREIAVLDAYVAERYPEENLPVTRLGRRFGLDEAALHLLLAAAAPALDLSLARRLDSLAGRPQPDAGFLVEATTRDLIEERRALAALRPTAPLVRWRLVRLGTSRGWSPETPLLHRPVMVPERVIEWLRGDVEFEPELFERAAVLRDPAQAAAESVREAPAAVARALFRTDGDRRLPLVVAGPALAGKAAAVNAVAAARGLAVLDVDLEVVAASAQPVDLLLDLVREAVLQDAVLLLRRADGLAEKRVELRRAVASLLTDGTLWTALTTRGEWRDDARRIPGTQIVEIDMPAQSEQLALWQRALPPVVPREPEVVLENIVARYRLTPGDILEAGADAMRRADLRSPAARVSLDDIEQAIRGRLRHRLGDVAELMTTPLGWDDLVVSENVGSLIVELLASIRYQAQVMERWGFGKKLASGRAVSALFSGPPGTGKTMVATLIAKELGLELFRVDLSRVVSKWVGETEKNLGRAFDEAKNSQAVLLFDEADALFAKRTDVKSSNDRYANLEVNYLLQRLEAFEGVVLLTTNNQTSIDDAFRRRLRFRIEFPAPDAAERELLWQAMLPPEVPVADDIDFSELAQRYEMTGGFIKNAVVRAAYLAAGEQQPGLTKALLLRAAQLEWEAMGHLTHKDDSAGSLRR